MVYTEIIFWIILKTLTQYRFTYNVKDLAKQICRKQRGKRELGEIIDDVFIGAQDDEVKKITKFIRKMIKECKIKEVKRNVIKSVKQ